MSPVEVPGNPTGQWALGNAQGEFVVYSRSSGSIAVDLNSTKGVFTVYWIDPRDGSLLARQQHDPDGAGMVLKSPTSGPVVAWVTRSP